MLALGGALATAILAVSYFAVSSAEQQFEAVNVSGRQRMLSQRIALLAKLTDESAKAVDREETVKELTQIIDLFERSHRALVHGDPEMNLSGRLSPELTAHYFGDPVQLDRKVADYVASARRLATDTGNDRREAVRDVLAKAGPLLSGLDAAVRMFQLQGQSSIASGRSLRIVVLLSAFLVLGLLLVALVANIVTAIARRSGEEQDAAAERKRIEDENRRLRAAVHAMRDGFVVYDKDDRFVLANEAFFDLHRPMADIIVPGITFEELLHAGLERGMWNLEGKDPETWVQDQLAARRNADEFETEVMLADGRCMVRRERRIENGDTIGTRIDVTNERAREDELKSTEEQLERLAFFDELTGLPNRFHCQKDLAEKFVFAESGERFAVVHLDLDNFKKVNDSLGHAAGDRLLTDIGTRLSILCDEIRNMKAYRWGGDEFIVTITRDDDVDLEEICQELTDDLAVPATFNGTILRPTVSIGIARYPEDGTDVDSLMKFADLALYATKAKGRDGYHFFTDDMRQKAETESWMETEMRAAIDSGMFSLVYQPQVNNKTGEVTGIEALIRWHHPEKGLISPGEFLPIAEATNMARPIGRMVFDLAMTSARAWLDRDLAFGRIAVNLSPQHLKSGTIYDDFVEAMWRHDIAPEHVTAEILESLLLDDPYSNKTEIIRQFHDLGVNIELDDFGTGYASLAHLSTLPIHGLKVDRSFTNQILIDTKKYSVVKTLINLAKMLRIGVVCEGIETGEQLASLRNLGEFSVQGYYIAKPMSFDDMTLWLEMNQQAQTDRASA